MKLCPTCAETLQYFGADVEVVPESECTDCQMGLRHTKYAGIAVLVSDSLMHPNFKAMLEPKQLEMEL